MILGVKRTYMEVMASHFWEMATRALPRLNSLNVRRIELKMLQIFYEGTRISGNKIRRGSSPCVVAAEGGKDGAKGLDKIVHAEKVTSKKNVFLRNPEKRQSMRKVFVSTRAPKTKVTRSHILTRRSDILWEICCSCCS